MLSKRVQVLLEEKEYQHLKTLGISAHKSIGEIFREAVGLYAKRLVGREERLKIVEKMSKIGAPVEGWKNMEKKIIQSHGT